MNDIIVRKDKTSISCPRAFVSKFVNTRKMKFIELTVAIVLIFSGMSIMLLAP